ncbi:hypothetical protein ACHAQH_004046 [Verticillium albo-atrum]
MPPLPSDQADALPRVITYYQTHHTRDGKPISILPILTQPGIAVTHVILAAIHINDDPSAITLNDHYPAHPRFQTLWAELRVLQASGVKVMGMLGGAAKGSYTKLDRDQATFERYWAPVRDLIRERELDGIDLDVEEYMSIEGMMRLLDRIRADFGPKFLISMAPVAAAMLDPERNLSGFDYEMLELLKGDHIDWYNCQFYNGWGDGSNSFMYEMMLAKGWPQKKIVIGLLTSHENGNGWVPWESLGAVLLRLRSRYREFGGVMGWEYFNGLPDKDRPWEWCRWMTTMVRPGRVAGVASGIATAPVLPTVPSAAETSVVAEKVQKQLVDEADPDSPSSKDAPLPAAFEYFSDYASDG